MGEYRRLGPWVCGYISAPVHAKPGVGAHTGAGLPRANFTSKRGK